MLIVQFPVLYVVGDLADERGQRKSAGITDAAECISVTFANNPSAIYRGAFPLDLSTKEPPRSRGKTDK